MIQIVLCCILEEKTKTEFLHPVFCPGRRFLGTDRQIHFLAGCLSDPTWWSNDRNIVSIHVLVLDVDMDALQGSFERPWTCSNTSTVISSGPGGPRGPREQSVRATVLEQPFRALLRLRGKLERPFGAPTLPSKARAAILAPLLPQSKPEQQFRAQQHSMHK